MSAILSTLAMSPDMQAVLSTMSVFGQPSYLREALSQARLHLVINPQGRKFFCLTSEVA